MLSTLSLQEHLLLQLEKYHPSSIIFLSSDKPSSKIQQWADENHCAITTLHHQQTFPNDLTRHDFAIVFDYLNHLDKNMALQRLGQLRNLYSHKIWVADHDSKCEFNDFIGLGFQRQIKFESITNDDESYLTENPVKRLQDSSVICYGYDLASYNHKRSWNNPKHWANPENWNKYRW